MIILSDLSEQERLKLIDLYKFSEQTDELGYDFSIMQTYISKPYVMQPYIIHNSTAYCLLPHRQKCPKCNVQLQSTMTQYVLRPNALNIINQPTITGQHRTYSACSTMDANVITDYHYMCPVCGKYFMSKIQLYSRKCATTDPHSKSGRYSDLEKHTRKG